MFSASNNRRSATAKTTAKPQMLLENLESRQMMTAAPFAATLATNLHALAEFPDHHPVQSVTWKHHAQPRPNEGAATPAANMSGLHVVSTSNLPLFSSNGPSINDINQGGTGDCYFLSALAEEASKNPAWIRQLVRARGDGSFDVFFYHNGWVDERVDGTLLADRQGKLAYAGLGQGNCTWVAIMEKAFCYFRASLKGQAASYQSIDTGSCAEALGDLGLRVTGDYTANAFTSGYNMGMYVYKELNLGYAIELMTNGNSGPLVTRHAYAVVGVFTGSSGALVVLVRNPWGKTSANGQPYTYVNVNQLMGQMADVVLAKS